MADGALLVLRAVPQKIVSRVMTGLGFFFGKILLTVDLLASFLWGKFVR